ncbi:MFS transporter [Priestia koreensis]|uniref:MFS transporter n=1 Tax=Priestia koreensis TaxID=284581 RepID=UPI001F58791A|nr:MFS transporter [Priestia koreensis]UNL83141.1 MFS transporter [Priestia koreensis]
MKKPIVLFFFVMFVIGTDTFLVSPLLPMLQVQYHVDVNQSGWIVSAYALGYAIFALIAGPISDQFDRKKVMMYGMIAFSLTTFLCGIAPTFFFMLLFRFLAGVSAAFVTPQVWASIPSLVSSNQILKSIGIASSGLAISQMLGLPIGSYFASFYWSVPFFVLCFCSLLLVVGIRLLPSIRSISSPSKSSFLHTYQHVFQKPGARKLLFAYFLFQMGNFAAFSFFGMWLHEDFHLSVTKIGVALLVLGAGNLCGSVLGPAIVKKVGSRLFLAVGLLSLAILYMILPLSSSLFIVEGMLFVIYFLTGILFPIMMNMMQGISVSARGTIAALSNTFMYGGTMIGSAAAAYLYKMSSTFSTVTLFTSVFFIISFFLFHHHGKTTSEVRATV